LKKLSADTRIIFVTSHEKYALEAFRIKAHGYLLKPLTVEDVLEELKYIPENHTAELNKLTVKCFGHFDVYWKGEPLIFTRKQSKELLAYLIDREGAACSSSQIAMALWSEGDHNKAEQNRIRVLVNDLRNTLKEIGMEELIVREHRELAVRRDMVDCDYYRMLDGDMDAVNSYRGEYMIDYSWAELTNAKLYFRKRK
ncbi:MAG: winged helix-turn-helix domain-containing protein, partial [Lachnospiraceae bacterium]|nr:winged helix-turn-helix domain-containing protein [Lachnospiraceae bacterium]